MLHRRWLFTQGKGYVRLFLSWVSESRSVTRYFFIFLLQKCLRQRSRNNVKQEEMNVSVLVFK